MNDSFANGSGGPGSQIPSTTSTGLLERVRAQEPDAWRSLVELYGPLVFDWCRRKGLQPEDAADVTQEVFQAVAANIATFRKDRPGDSFRKWLWTITQNKLNDFLRSRGAQPEATGGSEAQARLLAVPEQSSPSDPSARSAADLAPLLARALDSVRAEFEPTTWQAFWQTTVDGRLPADVAADLGVSVNAVYKAKSRVLRRLRELLGEAP